MNRTISKSLLESVCYQRFHYLEDINFKHSGSGVQHLTQTIGTVQQSQVQVFSVSSDSVGACKEDEVQARLHFDSDTLDTSR